MIGILPSGVSPDINTVYATAATPEWQKQIELQNQQLALQNQQLALEQQGQWRGDDYAKVLQSIGGLAVSGSEVYRNISAPATDNSNIVNMLQNTNLLLAQQAAAAQASTQKAQSQGMSKGEKIAIGVGVGAIILAIISAFK